MPERIRTILLHSDIADARDLAAAADKLHESFHTEEAAATVNKISNKRDKKRRDQN